MAKAPAIPESGFEPRIAQDDRQFTREDVNSEPGERLYPGQILAIHRTETGEEFNKRFDIENPIPCWYMEILEGTPDGRPRQWNDGAPIIRRQELFLTTFSGDPLWEGSEPDQLAAAFEDLVGNSLMPDEEGSDAFRGHWFMWANIRVSDVEEDKEEGKKPRYLVLPREHLGGPGKYKLKGKPEVVGSKNSNKKGKTGNKKSTGPDAETLLTILQELFDGEGIAELKAGKGKDLALAIDVIAANKKARVLDTSISGGLIKPNSVLIDKMIEEGYGVDDDGTFTLPE